ncbi:MAG: hypothetical protein WCI88_08140, partial [Chloroflexota bacterium]
MDYPFTEKDYPKGLSQCLRTAPPVTSLVYKRLLVQQRLDVSSVDVGLIKPVESGIDEFVQL